MVYSDKFVDGCDCLNDIACWRRSPRLCAGDGPVGDPAPPAQQRDGPVQPAAALRGSTASRYAPLINTNSC